MGDLDAVSAFWAPLAVFIGCFIVLFGLAIASTIRDARRDRGSLNVFRSENAELRDRNSKLNEENERLGRLLSQSADRLSEALGESHRLRADRVQIQQTMQSRLGQIAAERDQLSIDLQDMRSQKVHFEQEASNARAIRKGYDERIKGLRKEHEAHVHKLKAERDEAIEAKARVEYELSGLNEYKHLMRHQLDDAIRDRDEAIEERARVEESWRKAAVAWDQSEARMRAETEAAETERDQLIELISDMHELMHDRAALGGECGDLVSTALVRRSEDGGK